MSSPTDAHAEHGAEGTADEPPLTGYEVLVCVCGGIAAYKTASLVSDMIQQGCGVSVAMPHNL